MSCNSVLSTFSVPTLGSEHIAAPATGSEVTLVSAQDNVAGVLVVTASVWARSDENGGDVQSYLRSTNAFLVMAKAYGGAGNRDSSSACGGPFIIPAGDEVVVGGGTALCGYAVNWEVLS